MTKIPCEEFADRIVDYVDGELPGDEAHAVARHLAECERCQETAETLRRSLGLAQVLWQDNLAKPVARSDAVRRCVAGILPAIRGRDALDTHCRCPYGHTTNLPRRRSLYAIAAAASILLVTGGSFLLLLHEVPTHSPATFEDIQRQVARVGTAAELLAATRIVAQCEGTESIVQQQYRYILRQYADTPAAESLKADQNLKLGGMQND
jgi:anti-sigma factor RsiW